MYNHEIPDTRLLRISCTRNITAESLEVIDEIATFQAINFRLVISNYALFNGYYWQFIKYNLNNDV